MKNKLLAELKELATKILQITDQNSVSTLKQQAKDLYEKLTILAFTEENLASFSVQTSSKMEFKYEETKTETINLKESYAPEKQEIVKLVEEKDEYLPDGTEYNDTESIIEQNTEKIKDIVAEMPPETHAVDYMVNKIISANGTVKKTGNTSENNKKDFRDIGVDYDNLPNFQPVKQQDKERPRSINDRLKKGINIGLNERLAFIRHLFDGKAADYNRVISQLNTFSSVEESRKFIRLVVKPDYKNWVGKEEFEKKFMELVENKFDK
ncbi:MAG: hypothetical protein JJE07_01670 [Flavobacteriaceae bacterium]|nr:hypothetical protein [Flavobacteriaceae bacterium]